MTLALKYRPTQFQDLVGQLSVSQTLSLALDQQKISNAYLFSGLRGSGKTSSARIFARALQCDHGPTSKPCGICDQCKSALEGRHIDIIELDAASNRKIDDIRDLIEQTKYKPSFGRYKIFIIDEVHMLTKEAFNALLKTLEEPPSFVKFILATTDPLLLPATILSRTQHFRFKKIPQKSVLEHITHILQKENIPFEEEALKIIARSGSGSLRDTLTLLEQAIIFGNNSIHLQSVTEMLGIIDPQILENFFNAILQKNDALAQNILEMMQEYEAEMVLDEMLLFLKNLALSKSFNTTLLNRFFYILTQGKTLLSLNSDGEFVLLLSLLKMQEATKLREIHSLIGSMEKEMLHQIPSQSTPSIQTPNLSDSLSQASSNPALRESMPMQSTLIEESHLSLNQNNDLTSSEIPNTMSNPPLNQERNSLENQEKIKENNLEIQSSSIPTMHSNSTQGEIQEKDLNEESKGGQTKIDSTFKALIAALYDRNYTLGECFEKNIIFVSFNGQILTLTSLATHDQDKSLLKEQFPLIKSFVYQVFGEGTKIKFQQPTQSAPSTSPHSTPSIQTPNLSDSLSQASSNSALRESMPMQSTLIEESHLSLNQNNDLTSSEIPNTMSNPPLNQERNSLENQEKIKENNLEIQASSIPTMHSNSTQGEIQEKDLNEESKGGQHFALRHQKLLSQIQKHLQADLSTARKI